MYAISYSKTGAPGVLALSEVSAAEPGAGEIQVQVHRSGVNPADWRGRRGVKAGALVDPPRVPGNDGAGVVTAVGEGVDPSRVGSRVWLWEGGGTAQEAVIVREDHAVQLPDSASFDLGAALGVPFLTAHRCLTVDEGGPIRLGVGELAGRTVLVAGGAGAVGNAAIQLAHWSGATVIATVSSPIKAQLAAAAGADHILDYTNQDVAQEIKREFPSGVNTIVEVAPVSNGPTNGAVLADGGTLSMYANDGGAELPLSFGPLVMVNARLQFVMAFGVNELAKRQAVQDISAALAAGVIGVGDEFGLPIHHYEIGDGAAAHAAVEANAVGKVLIDIR